MTLIASEPLKGKSHQFTFENRNVESVQKSITNILGEMGYVVKSSDWQQTVYTKGNRILRLLLGAFVKYNKLNVSFSNNENKTTAVVSGSSSGFSGGVIGMAQVNKEFKKVIETLNDKLTTSVY